MGRLALSGRERTQIDVWLEEYQAYHRNRNHYDSTRWTIGSIFIAISFTLLGISFTEGIKDDSIVVIAMAVFSILIFVIFLMYNFGIQPWVRQSIERMHEIEEELIRLGFNIRLHHNIKEGDRFRGLPFLTGRAIIFVMTGLVLGVWAVRFWILYS